MFFFFKQKTAYEMRISDWSSDVCSSDLPPVDRDRLAGQIIAAVREQEDKEILKLGHRAETTQRHGVGARRARSGVGDGVELLPRAFGGEGPRRGGVEANAIGRSEEHTSELQSLMRISYAVFCLKKKNRKQKAQN